jgi:hypothetical protein
VTIRTTRVELRSLYTDFAQLNLQFGLFCVWYDNCVASRHDHSIEWLFVDATQDVSTICRVCTLDIPVCEENFAGHKTAAQIVWMKIELGRSAI